MAKFKVRMKLEGLELEIEGSRDDVPLIAQNISEQFRGLLGPSASIIEGEVNSDAEAGQKAAVDATGQASPKRKRAWRSPRPSPSGAGLATGAEPSWKHDPGKWGTPRQTWSIPDKILWFMYVAEQEATSKDLTSPAICSTFNKMFREAGLLQQKHMARDLGRLKKQSPAAIGEDTTKVPSAWFLTVEGKKKAESLVKEARGEVSVTS